LFQVSVAQTYFFFKDPWIFPIVIVAGGIITNFSEIKGVKPVPVPYRPIKWGNIVIFFSIFLMSGIFSGTSKKQDLHN